MTAPKSLREQIKASSDEFENQERNYHNSDGVDVSKTFELGSFSGANLMLKAVIKFVAEESKKEPNSRDWFQSGDKWLSDIEREFKDWEKK